VESLGYLCDARLLALNSYENRVYQVGIEDELPLIAKFYRPDRWTREQILEEHSFSQELVETDISVIAPMRDEDGKSLHDYGGFMFAIFERRGGHPPELDNGDNLLVLGRTLGRIHQVGASVPFSQRVELTSQRWARDSVEFVAENFIPGELKPAYSSLTNDLVAAVEEIYQPTPADLIRCHGDCHIGNILWRDNIAHFVDLDDCVSAPAIQDLWMFLSGERDQRQLQLSDLEAGYSEFRDFPRGQLRWIEAMRTMRIMYYSAWLARRWEDPAFPMAFPWFNSVRYWSDHILELREQMAVLQEPPLILY
jgi:Ser/Thr protein kinase RdoA (MazF antagonist)